MKKNTNYKKEFIKERRQFYINENIPKFNWLLDDNYIICTICNQKVYKYISEPKQGLKYRPFDKYSYNNEVVGYFEPKDKNEQIHWEQINNQLKIDHYEEHHPPKPHEDWENNWECFDDHLCRTLQCKLCGWPYFYNYDENTQVDFTVDEDSKPYQWNFNEKNNIDFMRNQLGEYLNAIKILHRRICCKVHKYSL